MSTMVPVSDDEMAQKFIGRWRGEESNAGGEFKYVVTYASDGQFTTAGTYTPPGGTTDEYKLSGPWSVQNSTLTYKVLESTIPPLAGKTFSNKVLSISDREVTLAGPDNTTIVNERVGFDMTQEMLTLSYITYAGMWGEASQNPVALLQLFNRFLDELQPVKGRWRVAWGPGIAKSPWELLTNDNVFFVAQDIEAPNSYAIAVRGTNPLSLPDMLVEVDEILRQEPWPYGTPAANTSPKISKGVSVGLQTLQGIIAGEGVPGGGQDVLSFFKGVVAECDGPVTINTTGHSLGGALAPTLGLWLMDTQGSEVDESQRWDPERKATIYTTPVAGFSAGNMDFAAHSDAQYGARCRRLHNSLDVVPHTYNAQDLAAAKSIYEPQISTNLLFKGAIDAVIAIMRIKGIHYLQIQNQEPPLQGTINDAKKHFFTQMLWQHVDGYLELLDLQDYIDPKDILSAHV